MPELPGFLGALNPFTPKPPVSPPFVTPPPPPRLGPPPQPRTEIPVSDFVTPMPDPAPIGEGYTTPQTESPIGKPSITLTPGAVAQSLVEVGFDPEAAAAITGQAIVHRLSPERIAELLQIKTPDEKYDKSPQGKAEVARIRAGMEKILADPRLKDEYVRGLDAIVAHVHPDWDMLGVSGQYEPVDREISIYDVSRRMRPGDENFGLHATAAHEIGHHIANWALGTAINPEGWALAAQLDLDRARQNYRGPEHEEQPTPFVTDYATRSAESGYGIAEDFAEATKHYFSMDPQVRQEFRQKYPARAKVLDAITFGLVHPAKEAARLGVADIGQNEEEEFVREMVQDLNIGQSTAAKALLEYEIKQRTQLQGAPAPVLNYEEDYAEEGPLPPGPPPDDDHIDVGALRELRKSGEPWANILKGFNNRVTDPEIIDALNAADMRDPWKLEEDPNRAGMSIPTGGGAVDQYLPLIREAALRYGLDPSLLAALVDFESGGNANAYRKDTGATGLGQVLASTHMAGRPSKEKLLDPAFNLDFAANLLAAGIKRYGSEDQSLAAYLGAIDGKGNITRARDANGTDGPKYISEIRKRQGGYKALQSGDAAGSPSRSRLWPIEGFDPANTRITTKFGGAQFIGEGMDAKVFAGKPKTADGRPMNTGVDLAVAEGTGVVNPDQGEVVDVRTVDGNHGGYGNSVKIQYGDGTYVRYSHLKDAPALKVGQTVAAGAKLGRVGATGNATGPHLDLEAQDAQGNYFDALQWVAGKGQPTSAASGGVHTPRAPFKPPFSYDPSQDVMPDLGWSAEELLAGLDEDPEFATVPAPRTLNSRSNKMTSGTVRSQPTTGMPAITGPDGATLQAVFNMILQITQQAHGNLSAAGYAPQMVWDPEAFDDGAGNPIGGFVPTGRMTETLAAVNQRIAINRGQITTLATLAAQAGRVPMVDMSEDGLLYQVFDQNGNPQFLESVDSRQQRMTAGSAVGAMPRDLLMQQSDARPMNSRQGPIAGAAPPAPVAEPAPQEAAPGGPPAAGPPAEGFPGDPVIGNGNFVDTNGTQFPSGINPVTGLPQGSAYPVNPDPMDTPANQAWLAGQPAPSVVPLNGQTPGQEPTVDQPMEALSPMGYEEQQ